MTPLRPAFYIRVSTDHESQDTSVEYQEERFRQLCERKGYNNPKFYYDRKTGTGDHRDGYKELIRDIQDGKIDLLMAKELGRLVRNQKLAFELKETCKKHNVHFVTEDNAIDTVKGKSEMFGIYAWKYEQEAQATSTRIKGTLETKVNSGLFIGSIPPYGYKLKKGKLEVRKDGSPNIVKRIYNEYLSGKGFDAIARGLHADKVKSPSQLAKRKNASPLWHGSTVRLILENENYIGNLVQGKTKTAEITDKKRIIIDKKKYKRSENKHEPIIDKITFDEVQTMIKSRRKTTDDGRPSRPHKVYHLFSSLIYCKDCERTFHFKANRRGYICGGYNKYGVNVCTDHLIHEQTLIDIVTADLNELTNRISDEKTFDKIKSKANSKRIEIKRELKSIQARIESLELLKLEAIEMRIRKEIEKSQCDYLVAAKDKELNELRERELEISDRLSETIDDSLFKSIKKEVDMQLQIKELTRETLNRFVDRIEVGKNNTIDVYYKFSGNTEIMELLMG